MNLSIPFKKKKSLAFLRLLLPLEKAGRRAAVPGPFFAGGRMLWKILFENI